LSIGCRIASYRKLTLLLGTLLFFPCVAGFAHSAEKGKAGVSDLKSAYIFNFIRFAEWPERSGQQSPGITLNVLEDAEVYKILQAVAEKEVAKTIGMHVESCLTEACIGDASAMFIGESGQDYQRLLKLVEGRPILTVSDIPGFASHGGMIEIKYQDEKLTFVVNVDAVKRAGIYISAQLLQLGEIVGGDHE